MGDQGNMEQNFWEQGNSVKVNFGEHLNSFLRNKGTTENFSRGTREHALLPPPPALSGRPLIIKKRHCTSPFKCKFLAEAYVFASTLRTSTRKPLPTVRQPLLLNTMPVYRVVLDKLKVYLQDQISAILGRYRHTT